jgi:arylsulfatase A-like enzyme
LQTTATKPARSTFCYAHFLLPHGPYFRDSSGAFNSVELLPDTYNKSLYASYLRYTNTIISRLVNNIVQQDKEAIIIVMSDHGFRDYKNNKAYTLPVFDNICALRIPDKKLLTYKDSWSTVNFFRYVLNSAYGQDIPYLKDSRIFLNY